MLNFLITRKNVKRFKIDQGNYWFKNKLDPYKDQEEYENLKGI